MNENRGNRSSREISISRSASKRNARDARNLHARNVMPLRNNKSLSLSDIGNDRRVETYNLLINTRVHRKHDTPRLIIKFRTFPRTLTRTVIFSTFKVDVGRSFLFFGAFLEE